MIVRGYKRSRVDDPRGGPRGSHSRCLVIRTIRMPSVESVAAAQRSPFSFVRETVPESADGDNSTGASEKEFPPSDDGETVAEYPNAVSLLGAGGVDMYVVCASDDDGVDRGGGRVEAYRWDTAERVCVARVDVRRLLPSPTPPPRKFAFVPNRGNLRAKKARTPAGPSRWLCTDRATSCSR